MNKENIYNDVKRIKLNNNQQNNNNQHNNNNQQNNTNMDIDNIKASTNIETENITNMNNEFKDVIKATSIGMEFNFTQNPIIMELSEKR